MAEAEGKADLWEEEFYGNKAEEEEKKRYISFYAGKEWYGIEITSIKGVVKYSPVTFLPGAPPSIAGVVNLRGNILSVSDLRRMIGLESLPASAESRLIVIENEGVETGLLVDKVAGTIDVPLSKIDQPMATLGGAAAEFIEGESEIEGRLLGILKVDRLLTV